MPLISKLIGCNNEAEARSFIREAVGAAPPVSFQVSYRPDAARVKCALVTAAHTRSPLDTDYRPKELADIQGTPTIVHCLEQLADAGILHVILVVAEDAGAELIVSSISSSGVRSRLELSVVSMPSCSCHASGILAARRLLPPEFLFVAGDHIFSPVLVRALMAEPMRERDAARLLIEFDVDKLGGLPDTAVFAYCTSQRVLTVGRADSLESAETLRARHRVARLHFGVEAGMMLLSKEVCEPLIDLACLKPYYTMAEAIDELARVRRVSYIPVDGEPWVSVETATQLEALRAGLFEQFEEAKKKRWEGGAGPLPDTAIARPAEGVHGAALREQTGSNSPDRGADGVSGHVRAHADSSGGGSGSGSGGLGASLGSDVGVAAGAEEKPAMLLTCWDAEEDKPDELSDPCAAIGMVAPLPDRRRAAPLPDEWMEFLPPFLIDLLPPRALDPRETMLVKSKSKAALSEPLLDDYAGEEAAMESGKGRAEPSDTKDRQKHGLGLLVHSDKHTSAIAAHVQSSRDKGAHADFLLRLPPTKGGPVARGGCAVAVESVPDDASAATCALPSGVMGIALTTVRDINSSQAHLVGIIKRHTPLVAWFMLAFGLYCGSSFGELVAMQNDVAPILRTHWLFACLTIVTLPFALSQLFSASVMRTLTRKSVLYGVSGAAICHAGGLALMAASFALTTFTQALIFSSAPPLFVVAWRILRRIPLSKLEWVGTVVAVVAAVAAPIIEGSGPSQAMLEPRPDRQHHQSAASHPAKAMVMALLGADEAASPSLGCMLLGDLLALLTAACDAAYYTFAKDVRNQLPLSVFFLALFLTGAIGLAVLSVLVGEVSFLAAPSQLTLWMDVHTNHFTLTLLTALAEMGAMCNFVYVLTYVQPLIVTVVVLVQPVVATVQGVALGSLPVPSTPSIIASLALLSGVGMVAAGSTDSVEEVNLDQAVSATTEDDRLNTIKDHKRHSWAHIASPGA